MVEQLHFHNSKWLFSLSIHELLIKIGKYIIYLQREAITLEDMLKQRLINQRPISFTSPHKLIIKKQKRLWQQGSDINRWKVGNSGSWAVLRPRVQNISCLLQKIWTPPGVGEHMLHWGPLTNAQEDGLLCESNPLLQSQRALTQHPVCQVTLVVIQLQHGWFVGSALCNS